MHALKPNKWNYKTSQIKYNTNQSVTTITELGMNF